MTGGTWWSGAGLAVLLVGACSGQSIEFEHTDGGAGRSPADSAGGTGGSQAGSTGGTSSGAGTPGRAGTGGTGAPDPELDTSCDYQTVIMADCAKGGCHKGSLAAAELDLSNTSGL